MSGQQGKKALPTLEPTPQGDKLFKVLGNAARVVYKGIARIEIIGSENFPTDRGYIVVANHSTEIDPVTVALPIFNNGVFPRFLAKDSLFRAPVLGYIMRKMAHIPVIRGSVDARKALITARKVVEAGGAVVIYPEGTTTGDPEGWPMQARTGAARLALALGIGYVCSWRGTCVAFVMKPDLLHLGIAGKFGLEAGYLDNEACRQATHRKVQRLFRLCLVKPYRHYVCFSDFFCTALVCWMRMSI